MRTLSIEAMSLRSAQGFCAALSGLQYELIETEDGRYQVTVNLQRSDADIITALDAIEEHVTQRADGRSVRIELDGHMYTLHGALAKPRLSGHATPA